MKRKLAILAATAAAMTASALPAVAQTSPNCQLLLTEGEIGYFPNGGDGYYDEVYGWHMWCQSPVYGRYVQR